MRINHNIPAIHTLNSLEKNNSLQAKAIEKLSSGLKINKAADDAAGLNISEKMRAQVRGLEQAERNILDGISLIQTAESGLARIHEYLQRARDLSVQASNGTLTNIDREQIQKELEQLKKGINDIANDTEFNEVKVLRPPIVETPPNNTSGKTDIVFVIDNTSSMTSAINNVRDNIDDFASTISNNGVDFQLGLVTYGDIFPTENGDPVIKRDFVTDVNTFKNYLNNINVSGGGDLEESGLEGIIDPAQGAISFTFRSDASVQFVMVTDAPVHDDEDGDGGDDQSIYDIDEVANELKTKGIKIHIVSKNNSYNQLKRLTEPTDGAYMDINGDFSSQLNTLANNIVTDAGAIIELEEMPTLFLQVGPNSFNTFSITLFDARTKNLGIEGANVLTREEAEATITKIDDAIKKVSTERAKFGSYQNALEHISNNVSNTSINITSSESRIRDTDMAKQMAEYTARNISGQSAQAMLTNANQLPQSILSLLK